jgi:alkylation response protein AidB-like acyl-CoA dehydrogenase
MDLHFSPEDERFRAELRSWLEENTGRLTEASSVMKGAGAANIMDAIQLARDWQKTLWEAGYVGLPWPKEYGGRDASFTEQVIATEELARVNTPPLINTIGLTILGPTLIRHGTEEQRRRYLPKILTAEELWCQGFSEPEAGSDLAGLRTRAELDGDEFVVNGQKVWTSLAPIADWCFLLVRTDPDAPKREGISYLLCDMKTPGLEVNPLLNAAGGMHFSEMFFDDVRIPRANLVGELNGGWQIARTTLEHERSGLSGVLALEQSLARLRRTAAELTRDGAPALDDDAISADLAQLWIEIEGLRHLGYRTLSAQIAGRSPGASASVGKLFASQLRQRIADVALRIEGPLAAVTKKSPHVVDRGRWHAAYFDAIGHSIGGGTAEIQRNTIAERVLGLPRSVQD